MPKSYYTPTTRKRMAEMYADGKSTVEIAEHFSVSPSGVWYQLRKQGVDVRNQSEGCRRAWKKRDKKGANRLEITGQRFGRLTVQRHHGTNTSPCGTQKSTWLCKCDCGRFRVCHGSGLTSGNSTSCGICVRK